MTAPSETVRTIRLRVDGDREAQGPLTLGQANALQWISALTDDHFLGLVQWIFKVPAGTTLERACAALSALVRRYESLRTTYHDGPDGPVQRVARTVYLPIKIHQRPAQPDGTTLSRELIAQLRAHPFDLAKDLPLRLAVAAEGDLVHAVVAVYSHMAADYVSMTVLAERFTGLLTGTVTDGDAPPHQPLDRADRERSPKGLRQADAALRYWSGILRRRPRCVLPRPTTGVEPSTTPTPRSADLHSSRVAAALDRITARTGASRAMAVLAALAAVLALRTGQRHVALYSPAANRLGVPLRDYVGTVSQDGLISLDVDQPDYDALVRHAGTALLRANRNSVFDAEALQRAHDRIAHERGMPMVRDGVFNNISGNAPPDLPTVATTETFIDWWTPTGFTNLLLFHLVRTEQALILELITGDNRYLPDAEMEALLLGTERVLAVAATGNVALDDLGALAGIDPIPRDGDWHFVDHSWIQLSEVNRVLRAALPGPARAFVTDEGPEGATIVAHLAAGAEITDPARAHLACLRRLVDSPTAITPHRYVLHRDAPADPTDPQAWRELAVLAEGDGRATDAGSEAGT
ncbi:condensation domain-containing protein [Verrucosispora sp. WMMA2121]|uniref:condensation domain-containing protein n=1 Tax=Verrucosispora sp. WMMA2121 TaxID=3015164 RepID=UPI0022B7434F|nr:condensation domain-containing protein [Verrucosispora sp. WMMA2121]MCZ7422213.1 condensation domain-containing protein [Verrucosispora sp. WMMA2121]